MKEVDYCVSKSFSCVTIQFIPLGHSVGDLLFIFFAVQVFLFTERSIFYMYFSAQTIKFISKIKLRKLIY